MRVLLTADPEFPVPPTLYGGIERIVAGLVEELTSRGHTVGLMAHPDSTAPAAALFPWPGARSQNRLDTIRNALALRRVVKAFRPDVLHSFSRVMYLLPLLRSQLPKVMSYQRDPSPRPIRLANRLARPGSLRFTGCSEHIARLGRAAGGEWSAIPNFVDVDRFTYRQTVPADAPLVFLSRVESIKGPDVAIEVARRAGRRLVIAGNHSATPDQAEFWKTSIEPEIGRGGVEYVGPVNDEQKNELLGGAAALLVPIQWDEPFGIVFAEALACGTPVISCPRGALPEIVTEDITGSLCRTSDELAVAVGRVDRYDRAKCRQTAETRFSRVVVAEEYERYYRLASPSTLSPIRPHAAK